MLLIHKKGEGNRIIYYYMALLASVEYMGSSTQISDVYNVPNYQ